jgi:hypothetical protein
MKLEKNTHLGDEVAWHACLIYPFTPGRLIAIPILKE